MHNPYLPPKSDLSNWKGKLSAGSFIGLIVLCALSEELISWYLVPIGNKFVASTLIIPGISYWTVRLTTDLIVSAIVFVAVITVFAKLSQANAYIFSTVTVIGYSTALISIV